MSDTASSSSAVVPPHDTAELSSKFVAPLWKHISERAENAGQREAEGTKRAGKVRGKMHPAWAGNGVWCEGVKLSLGEGRGKAVFYVCLFVCHCVNPF